MTKLSVSKHETQHKLKSFQEYSQASIAWIISSVLSVIFFINSYDFTSKTMKPYVLAASVIYAAFTLLQLIITAKIRRDRPY